MDTGHMIVITVKLLNDVGRKSCVWLTCRWSIRI